MEVGLPAAGRVPRRPPNMADMTRLCELSFICVWTSGFWFAVDEIEPTQGVLLKIDIEIGLDPPHHVEQMKDHLALGPVRIAVCDGLGHPAVKLQGVFDGARQLGHLADKALQHVMDGLQELEQHPVAADFRQLQVKSGVVAGEFGRVSALQSPALLFDQGSQALEILLIGAGDRQPDGVAFRCRCAPR